MIKFEDEKKKPSSPYLVLTPPLYQARIQRWMRDEGSEGLAWMQATDQTLGLSPFQSKKSGSDREVGGNQCNRKHKTPCSKSRLSSYDGDPPEPRCLDS